jgi:hypothetical protein
MAGYGRATRQGLRTWVVAVTHVAGRAVAGVNAGQAGLVFAGPGGLKRREPLERCWDVRFEYASPVRSFPSRRGQRHFPGLWWAATTSDHVGYESWLERDHVMMLDFDPAVVGFSSQPFQLLLDSAGERTLRHVPDFFVRRRDGTGVVIDVRPDDRIGPKDAAVFAATGRACASVGWSYQRLGALDPVFAANLRWLAGYRHPRCLRSDLAGRLLGVFAAPAPLLAGARAAGDPVAVLPVLFHLVWSGVLAADLAGGLLGGSSVIVVAGGTS